MSLRARLSILYTSIVGGILLIFGFAVYTAVRVSLISQVDTILYRSVNQLYPDILVDYRGDLVINPAADTNFSPGILFQLWNRNRELVIGNLPGINRSFDPIGLQSGDQGIRDANFQIGADTFHLRVLTVPLVIGTGGRNVGVIQIATSLGVVDATQRLLLIVLFVGVVISMLVAGIVGWFSLKQALAPLDDVKNLALQITRADDLSRRIPYHGPEEDEVGQLIVAFNQTLSRLENLFTTQRRFIADVGHELRTPLTVIKGNVDLLRRMQCMDEESMESIDNEVGRLTRMVGDLLLLAQAESGKLPLNLVETELDTLVLEALSELRVLAHETVRLKIGEIDQVLVCGDKDRLKQVLVNLIGNAIKYTPRDGEIIVNVGKTKEEGILEVVDSGPGIPEEDLPHIFERFYRGEKARTRQKDGKGYGLGLSIAYWIIRNHRGTIKVESKVGEGTKFIVTIPLYSDQCKELRLEE